MPLSNSRELNFVDAIKIITDGTDRHDAVSTSDTDLTLRIVKERQPILRSHTTRAISNCRVRSRVNGGGERDRTDDPLLAKQVLSQLSYTPNNGMGWWVWLDSNQRPPPYQDGALTD